MSNAELLHIVAINLTTILVASYAGFQFGMSFQRRKSERFIAELRRELAALRTGRVGQVPGYPLHVTRADSDDLSPMWKP